MDADLTPASGSTPRVRPWPRRLALIGAIAVLWFAVTLAWGAAYEVVYARLVADLFCDDFGPCPPWIERPHFLEYLLLAFTVWLPYAILAAPGALALSSLGLDHGFDHGTKLLTGEWVVERLPALAASFVFWAVVIFGLRRLARAIRSRAPA